MNFPSQIFFSDINHGYRTVILKKNSLWLLPLHMATYFYYEKMRRTMRTEIVSNLLKSTTDAKAILTSNLDIQNRLINGQTVI